jgi:ABC-type transporter Mla subunit MlaD
MRRLASICVLLLAGVGAVVMTGADGEDSKGKRYVIEFDNAFGLVESGEVKIGGVNQAGVITDFDLTDTEPAKVAVTVEVTKPGFDSLTTNANCGVRQQSLIGEYFIDCQPGDGKPLPDRGRVPVKQTNSTIPVDLINNVQRRPYRDRFRLILTELGVGLAGRPDELNEVIRRAHPGLRETTETLAILARQRRFIKDFVRDADRVSVAVEPKKTNLSRWAKEASETAAVQASRKDSIAEQWRKLPTFLAELQPTAAQLEATADEQIPLLRRFRTAAPELRAFLKELGPFSEDSRDSTKALGRASVEGRRALVESSDEIDQLRQLSTDLPRLAKPLRQLLETFDDRSRSVDNDPLAKKTAPPKPDKTAFDQSKCDAELAKPVGTPGQLSRDKPAGRSANCGFTGMEALWNYVYYQTLGINLFDELSHILRIATIQTHPCSPYDTNPTPERSKLCGNRIGLFAPGVQGAPDPTEGPGTASARGLTPEQNLRRYGVRRGAGQPEAPALPGQRDISRPHVALPPEVEDLLDSLRGGTSLQGPPAGGQADPTQLLDYLLAP